MVGTLKMVAVMGGTLSGDIELEPSFVRTCGTRDRAPLLTAATV